VQSGLKIGITFLCGHFFIFKKLELIQFIKLILEISKFWSNSLGNRFWNFCSDFEIAWVSSICVGVLFTKSSNEFTFLRWSFWYIWWGVLIWFYVNLRNFNPRNFQFFVGFSFKTIFAPSPTTMKFISKDVEFSCASFDICLKFVACCPRTETPTQKFKNGFTIFTPQAISPSLVSF